MATPRLVPVLGTLREEFNHAGPGRDRASDGWIADDEHAKSSAHFPNAAAWVRAIDVDRSGPWLPGFTFEAAIERLRVEHRDGRLSRLQNIIFDRRIASRSWGWEWRPYDGKNPHDKHAHLEARSDGRNWHLTAPWGLKEIMVASQFNDDDKRALAAAAEAPFKLKSWPKGGGLKSAAGDAVLNAGYPRRSGDQRTPTWQNLQDMQEDIDALHKRLEVLQATLDAVLQRLPAAS